MQRDKDKSDPMVGRTYRGEVSPPITTPEAVAALQVTRAEHARKPGAVDLHVYFVVRGIGNPILQASMSAYTDVRTAPIEVFDRLFAEHHEVPATEPAEESEKP